LAFAEVAEADRVEACVGVFDRALLRRRIRMLDDALEHALGIAHEAAVGHVAVGTRR
jgi:hypothetical protein